MDFKHLLNTEGNALLSKQDMKVVTDFIRSRQRVSSEEFEKAVTINDCPFAKNDLVYKLLGVGSHNENDDIIEDIIISIKRDNENGIGILHSNLEFKVLLEPVKSQIYLLSESCIEVEGETIDLYIRKSKSEWFTHIQDVSPLVINLEVDTHMVSKLALVIYYKEESIVLSVVRCVSTNGAVNTDFVTPEKLGIFAKDILSNNKDTLDELTKWVLRMAIKDGETSEIK